MHPERSDARAGSGACVARQTEPRDPGRPCEIRPSGTTTRPRGARLRAEGFVWPRKLQTFRTAMRRNFFRSAERQAQKSPRRDRRRRHILKSRPATPVPALSEQNPVARRGNDGAHARRPSVRRKNSAMVPAVQTTGKTHGGAQRAFGTDRLFEQRPRPTVGQARRSGLCRRAEGGPGSPHLRARRREYRAGARQRRLSLAFHRRGGRRQGRGARDRLSRT